MTLFVDSSALIALVDRTDQFHQAAKAVVEDLPPTTRFHTSNYVLDETITRLRSTLGVETAIRTAESIWASAWYTVHTVDHAIEQKALKLMRKYADHRLSFTDCTTVVLLEQLEVDRIVAFDEDFRKLGYHMLPDATR